MRLKLKDGVRRGARKQNWGLLWLEIRRPGCNVRRSLPPLRRGAAKAEEACFVSPTDLAPHSPLGALNLGLEPGYTFFRELKSLFRLFLGKGSWVQLPGMRRLPTFMYVLFVRG